MKCLFAGSFSLSVILVAVHLGFCRPCDSIIMGNSTFAAWSSYLGRKKEKVIAPVPWFGPKGPDYKDLLDDNWIFIKT